MQIYANINETKVYISAFVNRTRCKDTYIYAKRPTDMQRDLHICKEIYIYAKRPVHNRLSPSVRT